MNLLGCLAHEFGIRGIWPLKPNACLSTWNRIPGIKIPNPWVYNIYIFLLNVICFRKNHFNIINDHWQQLLGNFTINVTTMNDHDQSTVTTINRFNRQLWIILIVGFEFSWSLIINPLDCRWLIILINCDLQLRTLLSWSEYLDRRQPIVIVNYRSHAY